jgi:hypothetical protein
MQQGRPSLRTRLYYSRYAIAVHDVQVIIDGFIDILKGSLLLVQPAMMAKNSQLIGTKLTPSSHASLFLAFLQSTPTPNPH